MSQLKAQAATAALVYLDGQSIIGVGTGSTVNYLIEQMALIRHRIDACVASSMETEKRLRAVGIPVVDLNAVDEVPVYIDGADELTMDGFMIKGGGAALTREKIIATAAKQFICIVDDSKVVTEMGVFPVAVEVIPMARSLVARELVKLGGSPCYREGVVTDNGNIILDVYDLDLRDALWVESAIKGLTGVVECGVFARRRADRLIIAGVNGVETIQRVN